jgi:hypothetical protein
MVLIVFAFLFTVVPIRVFVFLALLKRKLYGIQVITNILVGAVCVLILSELFGGEDSAPKTLFALFFIWATVELMLCIWSTSRWLVARHTVTHGASR